MQQVVTGQNKLSSVSYLAFSTSPKTHKFRMKLRKIYGIKILQDKELRNGYRF